MARYHGMIGFRDDLVETSPGVWEATIIEKPYFGDVIRDVMDVRENEKVNYDISIGNAISIVADPYAQEHIFAMKYLTWQGVKWSIRQADVDTSKPRITIRLGGVYNEQTN